MTIMDADYPVPTPYDVPPSMPVNVHAIVDGNGNTLYVFTYPEPEPEPVPIIARRLDG
jgi:hypothetical protein